jgi:hypothetical protein
LIYGEDLGTWCGFVNQAMRSILVNLKQENS